MNYDDLEKTQELFLIKDDAVTSSDNSNNILDSNVTTEFTLDSVETAADLANNTSSEPQEEPKDLKKKKEKVSFKEKWTKMSKKKRFLIIGSIIVIFVTILIIILMLVLDKNDIIKPKDPDKPQVVVEKENYIYKDGKLTLLGLNDTELGIYECENKAEDLCYVAYFSEEDEFDIEKNVYEDDKPVERRSNIFYDNFVFIYDNKTKNANKLILYNITEKKTEGTFDLVKGFTDSNYVIVKDGEKYGAIEFNRNSYEEKIKPTLEYLGMASVDAKLVAKTDGKYYIYNKAGTAESKGVAYEIKNYTDKYYTVYNDGYYVYDYASELLFDDPYDYIELLSDYVVAIKDNRLYIRDYEQNKYNEEGIELANDNYVKTNIYTSDKVLDTTKKAYDIAINESNLEVKYLNKNNKEKTETISIYEGKFSKNFMYLNYFDGKLFFYKDENKSDLIGSYNCINKNNVDKNTMTFSNCLVATDTFYSKNEVETDNSDNVGWIPIFNERYVFILDSLDLNNPTVVLYDLKNKKTLSKYESVDTGSYTKEHSVTLRDSETVYVMAKNKNGKYGVIRIEDEVKSAVPFNYASLEKMKDYYMAKSSSGTYVLIDNTGKEVSSKYGYKILDYNDDYLTVSDNNKYAVYDFTGDKIDNTSYLYVLLQDDYYIVVTTDKYLDIRKYDDDRFSIANPIDVSKLKNYKDFTVISDSDGYTITINETKKTYNIPLSGENDREIDD